MVAHPDAARPSLDAAGAAPVDLLDADHADHLQAARRPARSLVRRTLARARPGHDHDRVDPAHRGDAVHVQPLRRDARGGVVGAGRDRTGRWGPDRQLRDIDPRSRGGAARRGLWGPTRPPPAELPLRGEPRWAPARPPAARHTGRAALPLATFPHKLPAVRQIPGPFRLSQHSGGTATGNRTRAHPGLGGMPGSLTNRQIPHQQRQSG